MKPGVVRAIVPIDAVLGDQHICAGVDSIVAVAVHQIVAYLGLIGRNAAADIGIDTLAIRMDLVATDSAHGACC